MYTDITFYEVNPQNSVSGSKSNTSKSNAPTEDLSLTTLTLCMCALVRTLICFSFSFSWFIWKDSGRYIECLVPLPWCCNLHSFNKGLKRGHWVTRKEMEIIRFSQWAVTGFLLEKEEYLNVCLIRFYWLRKLFYINLICLRVICWLIIAPTRRPSDGSAFPSESKTCGELTKGGVLPEVLTCQPQTLSAQDYVHSFHSQAHSRLVSVFGCWCLFLTTSDI